jgi:hypothetical protein
MSEIYYKGTTADMSSYPPDRKITFSIGPVFNGNPEYGICAFLSKQTFNYFVWAYHSAQGLPYGPEHAQPVRFFAVTGDKRIAGTSPAGKWEDVLKREGHYYGDQLVILDNVQFLYEISFEEMGIVYAHQNMRNYYEANKL